MTEATRGVNDNKVRISWDVLESAQQISDDWGLGGARYAIEAVFRTYSQSWAERQDKDALTAENSTGLGDK